VTFAQLYATSAAATASDLDKALTDAHRAIALAPNLTEGHLALAGVYEDLLEFARANEEYARALTLGPGSARALRDYGVFAAYMGRGDSALKALHQAVVLDSMNANSYVLLADGLGTLRRYKEAIEVLRNAPGNRNGLQPEVLGDMGVAYYKLGDLKGARASCEGGVEEIYDIRLCLALTYEKLGRHGDADTMLAKIRAQYGDAGAVGYSEFYAQRGDTPQALDWLEMALRQRNPDLRFVKTDALFDPLRKEPRFQAIERALKFPD